jgi:hypothetical protein
MLVDFKGIQYYKQDVIQNYTTGNAFLNICLMKTLLSYITFMPYIGLGMELVGFLQCVSRALKLFLRTTSLNKVLEKDTMQL